MSVTFGFYNSKEGDRRYDAIQMSSIFDGIIQDGILQHVGTAMVVKRIGSNDYQRWCRTSLVQSHLDAE